MDRARDSDSKSPGRLQILHYNIDRFPEIKDLRGLETLLVARSVKSPLIPLWHMKLDLKTANKKKEG